MSSNLPFDLGSIADQFFPSAEYLEFGPYRIPLYKQLKVSEAIWVEEFKREKGTGNFQSMRDFASMFLRSRCDQLRQVFNDQTVTAPKSKGFGKAKTKSEENYKLFVDQLLEKLPINVVKPVYDAVINEFCGGQTQTEPSEGKEEDLLTGEQSTGDSSLPIPVSDDSRENNLETAS